MGLELSVIIPTRNRAALLKRCLNSLCNQTFSKQKFEVWVIDNNSKDETKFVCDEFKKKLANFNYYLEPKLGLHVARNTGLKLSRGEILVYADDDIRAFPTWLEGVAETIQDTKSILVGGKILPEYETPPPMWLDQLWSKNKYGKWLGYYSLLDFGDVVQSISPLFVWGCNFSIRKFFLKEIGGFHPDGMPKEFLRFRGDGETGVALRMLKRGFPTIYNPRASVYHFVTKERMTEKYLKQRAYQQGISDSYTYIRRSRGIKSIDDISGFVRRLVLYWKNFPNPLKKVLYKSYWQGYYYHRMEVKKDPALLEWVLKQDYMAQ